MKVEDLDPKDRRLIVAKIKQVDRLKALIDEGLEALSDRLDVISRAKKFADPAKLATQFARLERDIETSLPAINRGLNHLRELNELVGPIRADFPEAAPAHKQNGEHAQPVEETNDDEAMQIIKRVSQYLDEASQRSAEDESEIIEADDKTFSRLKLREESAQAKPGQRERKPSDLTKAQADIAKLIKEKD